LAELREIIDPSFTIVFDSKKEKLKRLLLELGAAVGVTVWSFRLTDLGPIR